MTCSVIISGSRLYHTIVIWYTVIWSYHTIAIRYTVIWSMVIPYHLLYHTLQHMTRGNVFLGVGSYNTKQYLIILSYCW